MEEALLRQVNQLCKGNKAKAKQLIDRARAAHPNQTTLWYLQKVISDLEGEQAEYFRRRRTSTPQPSQPTPSINHDWNQQLRLRQAEFATATPKPAPSPTKQQTRALAVNYSNWLYLMTLLHGNQDTALRLIASAQSHNPGRSDQWALEKVIFDLERDRH